VLGGQKGVAEVEKTTPRQDIGNPHGGSEVFFSMDVEKGRQQMGQRRRGWRAGGLAVAAAPPEHLEVTGRVLT
jgi:hypothetical protein